MTEPSTGTSHTGMPAPQFGDESSCVRGSEEVQEVPVFPFDLCKMFSHTPGGYAYPSLKTTVLDNRLTDGEVVSLLRSDRLPRPNTLLLHFIELLPRLKSAYNRLRTGQSKWANKCFSWPILNVVPLTILSPNFLFSLPHSSAFSMCSGGHLNRGFLGFPLPSPKF
jgi:hypothetical protein